MKNTWAIVRIVCALVVIFSLGIWVGRSTAPQGKVVRLNAKGKEIVVDDANGRERGSRADKVTIQVVKRYKTELQLSKEQLEEMRPLFLAAGKKMVKFPAYSDERIQILAEFHKEIEPFLNGEQKEKLAVLRPGGK